MTTAADDRLEVGRFLRSRRERVRPEDVGLPGTERRRVPGLRREELARLAGISVEYYGRLEQGRAGTPSESVIVALARALRLDQTETDHLRNLSRRGAWSRPRAASAERVRPALVRMLEAIDTPALIFGRRTDVLAWNAGAAALLTDFAALPASARNLARLVFLDDGFRALMVDWEPVARETVGVLRMAAGRYPDDPALAALVGELTVKSDDFSRWWRSREVRRKSHGTKRLVHPVVGPLAIAYETLRLPDEPDQVLVTYYAAEPGSPADTALRLLKGWSGIV
jgi:transcriptional regulator with XRE-family HTH domain